MLYGNQSISHYSFSNISVWMTMAFQAGLLNTGGFMACHRFVSHVTGFATFFGLELTQSDLLHALGMLSVPLFFLFGAMISALLVDIRLQQHRKPKYYFTFGLIFLLTLAVWIGGMSGIFGIFGEPLQMGRDYALLALLCLICGMQNATITSVSRSVIRTTHLTGITTDLGIGLVRFFHRDRLPDHGENDIKANWMRMGIILFFGLGCVAGGFLFTHFGYGGFLVPVATSGSLFALMLYFQQWHRHPAHSSRSGQ